LFDAKKRLGTLNGGSSTERVQQQSDEGDSQTESWVELAPSRASLCSSVEAVMVDRDSAEANGSKDSRLSPVSLQGPHVEFEPTLDQVKYQLVKDMLPPGKNTDWIWNWDSRPEREVLPPSRLLRNRNGQIGSTLTTPPNSPEAEMSSEFEYKNGKVKKSIFYRFEVIVGLFVSNLMTFVIGATIGFWICKKISKSHEFF